MRGLKQTLQVCRKQTFMLAKKINKAMSDKEREEWINRWKKLKPSAKRDMVIKLWGGNIKEYDSNGKPIYYENSAGEVRGKRPNPSCEGKIVEIDGKKYKLTEV